jgi:hypothetical protein
MSHEETNIQPERFEIRLPASHSPQDKMAFLAMLKSFGWEYKDLTPDSRVVSPEQILETAEKLFDSTDAGQLALATLDEWRKSAQGSVYDTLTSSYDWQRRTPYSVEFSRGSFHLSSIGLNMASDEESVARTVVDTLADNPKGGYKSILLPFDIIAMRASSNPVINNYGVELFYLEPGPYTKQGLKNYVEQRDWHNKVPSGILGRMARLFGELAELDLPAEDEKAPKLFISVQELARVAAQELGPGTVKGIIDRINQAYFRQLHGFAAFGSRNSYDNLPELCFEGLGTGYTNYGRTKAEQLALNSISVLATHYTGQSEAIQFLKNFDSSQVQVIDLSVYDTGNKL